MLLAGMALFVLLLVACQGDTETTASTPTSNAGVEPTPTIPHGKSGLAGTEWQLAAMADADLDLQDPITINFAKDAASGYSGCNNYGGLYSATIDGMFAMSEIEMTAMDCESGTDIEAAYIETLTTVTQYEVIEDTRLELRTSEGSAALVFTAIRQSTTEGNTWLVATVDGNNLVEGTEISIELYRNELSGSTGCNSVGGIYEADSGGNITFNDVFVTERGCTEPQGIMEQESAFLDALFAITGYEEGPTSDEISFLDAEGRVRLTASKAAVNVGAGELENSDWILASINTQPLNEPLTTIRFDNGQISGSIACEQYSGQIAVGSNRDISTISTFISQNGCPDQVLPADFASQYLSALGEAVRFELSNDSLVVIDSNGAQRLEYAPSVDDPAIENSAWRLTALKGTALVAGAEISLNFVGGLAGGIGGCNGYGAPYFIPNQGTIILLSITFTNQGCPEPSGLEEQERRFFAALGTVVEYQVQDNNLELFDRTGAVVLHFEHVF